MHTVTCCAHAATPGVGSKKILGCTAQCFLLSRVIAPWLTLSSLPFRRPCGSLSASTSAAQPSAQPGGTAAKPSLTDQLEVVNRNCSKQFYLDQSVKGAQNLLLYIQQHKLLPSNITLESKLF